MNLILVYGPPAAGKYTIGSIVAQKLRYGFLHNHLTVDFVEGVFPFGSPRYRKLSKDLRLDIIKAVVRNRVKGLVMTYLFALDSQDDWRELGRYRRAALARGGKMFMVELRCGRNELHERISNKSRRHFHKISSPKKLQHLMSHHAFQSSDQFPARTSTFIFDTTSVPPEITARRIIKALRLRR